MTTSANELYGSPEPKISVILPVLNESKYLEEAVKAVLDQDFGGEIEIILAIGPSTDGTEVIAQSLAKADSRVVVVSNPSGRTASGLNLAVAASRYSIIVRVDGHSKIPKNYLSLAFEILKETGGFDERFTRAQDWELNFRLRAAGGTIFFDPRLVVTYRPRSTVKALAKQYFEYGRWRRVVSRRHEGTINYRYLAPPFTVIGVALSLILGAIVSPILFVPALVYALFILIASARIGKSLGEFVSLPLILLTMHMTWGIGFLTSPKSLAPAVTLRP